MNVQRNLSQHRTCWCWCCSWCWSWSKHDNIPAAYDASSAAAGAAAAAGNTSPVAGVSGCGMAEAVTPGSSEVGNAGGGPMVAKAPAYAGYHWQDATGRWHYFRQAIFSWGWIQVFEGSLICIHSCF